MRRFWNGFRQFIADLIFWLLESDLLPGRSLQLRRAEQLAQAFLACGAYGAQLYGSLARNGDGNDIDLVVIVGNDTSREFVEGYRLLWNHDADSGGNLVEDRKYLACNFTGLSVTRLEDILGEGYQYLAYTYKWQRTLKRTRVSNVDVYLFPRDWQYSEWLEGRLPCTDPNFLDNISRDTVAFNRITNRFEGIPLRRHWYKYVCHAANIRRNVDRRWWWFWFKLENDWLFQTTAWKRFEKTDTYQAYRRWRLDRFSRKMDKLREKLRQEEGTPLPL